MEETDRQSLSGTERERERERENFDNLKMYVFVRDRQSLSGGERERDRERERVRERILTT